jgi:hypothetical protein
LSNTTEAELMRRVKSLSEQLWEGRCRIPDVELWLSNFDGRHLNGDEAAERLHALHLLSAVSYFGLVEIRVLLRSMFRDLYRYPIVQQIREDLNGSTDVDEIHRRFDDERNATRFIGVGNPAESGTHLLYYFRQENRLNRSLFVHQHEILSSAVTDPNAEFVPADLRRLVFIDDLCGSGEQAVRYSKTLLRDLREVAARKGRPIEFQYLVLFGTNDGMARARAETTFDVVDAVFTIDETYPTFGPESRVFRSPPEGVSMSDSEELARGYGRELSASWPVGFDDGQLLLAFHHNVPDNTLPIIWFDEGAPPWHPAFARYPKVG